jgi:hypothetical protein
MTGEFGRVVTIATRPVRKTASRAMLAPNTNRARAEADETRNSRKFNRENGLMLDYGPRQRNNEGRGEGSRT